MHTKQIIVGFLCEATASLYDYKKTLSCFVESADLLSYMQKRRRKPCKNANRYVNYLRNGSK